MINWGPYYALKGQIAQGEEGSSWSSPLRSEGSRDDQAEEAGPFYWRPRVSKLTQRGLSCSSPLRSEGSCHSQAGGWSMSMEANSRATFFEDAQMTCGKQF
jgi:hypothetical protein